jgi:predicted DNA binding protein
MMNVEYSRYKFETIEYKPAMTFTEIADELGISNTAVMEIYARAMYKLYVAYVRNK